MYIIINNTIDTNTTIEGEYPLKLVKALLQLHHDFIIIDLYSNKIKIPNKIENLNGNIDYLWKEYPLPIGYINKTRY